MEVNILDKNNSVLNYFLWEIRDQIIQKDPMRFRRNLERIAEVACYEMSKKLHYKTIVIETPLGTKSIEKVQDDLVLCSILRAGLPMHQGVLNYFDRIENGFISAYRHHITEEDFDIVVEYLASPSLKDKVLLLVDPMLATGKSLVNVMEALKSHGNPKEIHIISAIGTEEGIDYLDKNFPENTILWIGSVDESLNRKGYIVPGLGDAGDLAFGTKL